jgi:small subunit ribosomal protein S6
MKKYDLTVLVKNDKIVAKIEALVKALDGKLGRMTDMGKKQLAYPIAKQTEAQFISWVLELPATAVVQLEKKLVNDKEVLRHLLVCLRDH